MYKPRQCTSLEGRTRIHPILQVNTQDTNNRRISLCDYKDAEQQTQNHGMIARG